MAQTLKFGNKTWATKVGSTLAYNDENGNYKPLPFAFTRSTSATRVNKEGLIEVVTNDRPRIDYTDTSDGVLLLEKAATNRFLYSEDLTQFNLSSSGTGASNPVVTSNYGVSPDGTQNADRVQLDAGTDASGNSRITETFTIFATTETISVYLKSNDGQEHTIDIIQSNSPQNTATVTSEWKRFSFTNVNGSPDKYGIGLTGSNGETADILAWGFQLEQNSVASSYIPTQGSASTRVAETASGSGNSEVFNDSEGVLFADISALANDGNGQIRLMEQGVLNSVIMEFRNSGTTLRTYIFDGNATNQFLSETNINPNDNIKIALKYKQNDCSLYLNGFVTATDTNATMPSNLNTLSFNQGDGSNHFYGSTKEIGYYNTILTDLELETLTSYKSWTSMVNELNLNIIYNG